MPRRGIWPLGGGTRVNMVDLGTGQNLPGTRAGTIDRGAKTFFRKKLGGTDFSREKLGGEEFFSIYFEKSKFHFSKKKCISEDEMYAISLAEYVISVAE